jgi:hypothetical protein
MPLPMGVKGSSTVGGLKPSSHTWNRPDSTATSPSSRPSSSTWRRGAGRGGGRHVVCAVRAGAPARQAHSRGPGQRASAVPNPPHPCPHLVAQHVKCKALHAVVHAEGVPPRRGRLDPARHVAAGLRRGRAGAAQARHAQGAPCGGAGSTVAGPTPAPRGPSAGTGPRTVACTPGIIAATASGVKKGCSSARWRWCDSASATTETPCLPMSLTVARAGVWRGRVVHVNSERGVRAYHRGGAAPEAAADLAPPPQAPARPGSPNDAGQPMPTARSDPSSSRATDAEPMNRDSLKTANWPARGQGVEAAVPRGAGWPQGSTPRTLSRSRWPPKP